MSSLSSLSQFGEKLYFPVDYPFLYFLVADMTSVEKIDMKETLFLNIESTIFNTSVPYGLYFMIFDICWLLRSEEKSDTNF